MAMRSGTSQAALTGGRRLYIASCTGCHDLYATTAYTRAEWAQTVEDMGRRAKLDAAQRSSLLRYLTANARNAITTPAP
jgi:hypothetical protein